MPTFTKTQQCLVMTYHIRKTCITEIVLTVNSFRNFSGFVLMTIDQTGKGDGLPITCHVGIQESRFSSTPSYPRRHMWVGG
jgi:hypothetical protein